MSDGLIVLLLAVSVGVAVSLFVWWFTDMDEQPE